LFPLNIESVRRKILIIGLEKKQTNSTKISNFKLFGGKINVLAFSPISAIRNGMIHLKSIAPEDALNILEYFDSTYATGTYKYEYLINE